MFERYARQTALDGFGLSAQKKISASTVALVGVGGVGSGVLPILAGAGIGSIKIFDCDTVSATNLHRQTIYKESQIGQSKARMAAEFAQNLNSEISVEYFDGRVSNPELIAKIFAECDICIDATDSFASRMILAKACRIARARQIAASAERFVSQVFFFGDGFYLDDIVSDADAAQEGSAGLPIFAAAAQMSGMLAAASSLRIIAGVEEFDVGRMIYFDNASQKFTKLNLRDGESC